MYNEKCKKLLRQIVNCKLYTLHSSKGFSFVELLIVMTLVGFAVLVVNGLPNAIRLIGQGQREGLAKEIASRQIENLRSQGYVDYNIDPIAFTDPKLSELPSPTALYTIRDCSVCSGGEQIKEVEVTVSWVEKSTTKEVNLTTMIAEGGL